MKNQIKINVKTSSKQMVDMLKRELHNAVEDNKKLISMIFPALDMLRRTKHSDSDSELTMNDVNSLSNRNSLGSMKSKPGVKGGMSV